MRINVQAVVSKGGSGLGPLLPHPCALAQAQRLYHKMTGRKKKAAGQTLLLRFLPWRMIFGEVHDTWPTAEASFSMQKYRFGIYPQSVFTALPPPTAGWPSKMPDEMLHWPRW